MDVHDLSKILSGTWEVPKRAKGLKFGEEKQWVGLGDPGAERSGESFPRFRNSG